MTYEPMPVPPANAFSADGNWWWNGAQWLPAALSGWLLYGAVVLAISQPGDPGTSAAYTLAGLAVVAVLATCSWGFAVGRRRALRWLWPASAVGTAVLMLCYVVAMLAAPASDGSDQDNAAGAGRAFLTIPTAIVLLTLLWAGAGLGVLLRSRLSGDRP